MNAQGSQLRATVQSARESLISLKNSNNFRFQAFRLDIMKIFRKVALNSIPLITAGCDLHVFIPL